MSQQLTFWDEFLQVHVENYKNKIEDTTPRALLEAFYHWLGKRGALSQLEMKLESDQGGAGKTRIDGCD